MGFTFPLFPVKWKVKKQVGISYTTSARNKMLNPLIDSQSEIRGSWIYLLAYFGLPLSYILF